MSDKFGKRCTACKNGYIHDKKRNRYLQCDCVNQKGLDGDAMVKYREELKKEWEFEEYFNPYPLESRR